MFKLTVNGRTRTVDVEPEMPLLWVLRGELDLPGTKYGCGAALCGACTVLVDGEAVRSCSLPASATVGKKIVTIEGLPERDDHGGRRAAREELEAERCRHRRDDDQSVPLRHVCASASGAPCARRRSRCEESLRSIVMTIALTRREFLKVSSALGGGLALEFWFPAAEAATGGSTATEVNAWIVIHPDDRVVIRIARSEMGQGTYTALAQLVAEELDCDWTKVSAEFASPNENVRRNRIWGSMSTGGSQGVRSSQDYVRKAGASGREMLIAAAAAQWKARAAECSAASGVVTHAATGRKLRYGEVAAAAAKLTPPQDVKLRDPAQWKIAGKPLHRLDIPDKVQGKPVFAADVTLPGMLHASIAQCPVFGG
jgi:hypothetical protein